MTPLGPSRDQHKPSIPDNEHDAKTISIGAPVQYLVIGDNASVTVIEGGVQREVPYLAPSRLQRPLIGRDSIQLALRESLEGGYVSLHGAAGCGKSALALDLASDPDALRRFPDGVLWAGLGPHPNVLSQLGIWGRSLGVRPEDVTSPTAAAWTIAIRSAIGLRRLLLVIDDAWDVEDAFMFQVGGPNCSHILTTRIRDVAYEFGGDSILVEELNHSDAHALLEVVAGRPVDERVLQLTAALPLAIVLIGHKARSMSDGDLLPYLADTAKKLTIARRQAPASAHSAIPFDRPLTLDAIIGLSYSWVDSEAQAALAALTALPSKPNTFSLAVAARVANCDKSICEFLTNSALLEPAVAGRLTMHQLVHDYAALKVRSDSSARQMVATYLVLLEEGNLLTEGEFNLEYRNLLAALDHAVSLGLDEEIVRLTELVYPALEQRGLYTVARPYLEHARRSAQNRSDSRAEIQALLRLGNVALETGALAEGRKHLEDGVALAATFGLADDVTDLLSKLGWASGMRGDLENAQTYFSDALSLSTDKRRVQALQGLGWVAGLRGQHNESREYLRRGIEFARMLEDVDLIADLLQVQGWMDSLGGSYADASVHFDECLILARQNSLKPVEVDALHGLGVLSAKQGYYSTARDLFTEALAITAEIEYHERVPILQNLGSALRELGDLVGAEAALRDALEQARQQGRPEKLSEALAELGLINIRQRKLRDAESLLTESLDVAERVKVKAPRVQALRCLAILKRETGHVEVARDLLTRALRMESDNAATAARLRQDLGELELSAQRYEAASRYFIAVHAGAGRTGQRELAALANFGSARALLELGGRDAALSMGTASVDELRVIDSPRTDEVASWLNEVSSD